jgi:uncharacterized protein DUF5667
MKPTRDEQAFAELLDGLRDDAPGDVARFARLAVALEHVRPAPGPAPDFRNVLRNRLIAEAAGGVSLLDRFVDAWAERNARMRRNFKMVFATAVAAVVLLAGGSVFAVAQKSVPGDWDYWAKRLHENAHLLVTRAPVQRAFLQMDLARERLDEVRTLVNRGQKNSDPYFVALNDMDARTLDAARLLVESFLVTHAVGPLDRLNQFAVAQRHGLEVLIDRLPPGARPPARDSIDILQRVQDRVTGILAGCPCPSNPLLPKVSSGPETPSSEGEPSQSPACDCAKFRGDDGSNNNAAGPGDNPPEPPPEGPPPTPPPDDTPPIDKAIGGVTDTVNGTTGTLADSVNKLIDDALNGTPLESVIHSPVPTVTIEIPPIGH